MNKIIVVAGGTGELGHRIIKALLTKNVEVRALVRAGSDKTKVASIKNLGATVIAVNLENISEITEACRGASCVVSALAGLRDVIINTQKNLLDGAIAAGVPRFIPSDYSLDFTKFSAGENRNLDWRREFHTYLDKTSIAATSIFNGAFMDMLTEEMPLIILKPKLILYWGNADHKLWFTTMNDTAAYTANVALDDNTPRYLRIAGDLKSPRELKPIAEEVTGEKFRMFRPGGLGLLSLIIKITRKFSPAENELYPAWQGMQYMRNMIDERATLAKTDNNRYPDMTWTSVKELLHTKIKNLNS